MYFIISYPISTVTTQIKRTIYKHKGRVVLCAVRSYQRDMYFRLPAAINFKQCIQHGAAWYGDLEYDGRAFIP